MLTTWTCVTKDTQAVISYQNDALILESLSLSSQNRAIPWRIALPQSYLTDKGQRSPFQWQLCRQRTLDNGFDVLLCDDQANCTYHFYAKARKDIAGPIEFSGKLTNRSHNPVRIFPQDIFSAAFAFDKPVTSWRFMKESGVAENVSWYLDKNTFFPGSGIYCDDMESAGSVIAETNTSQDFNTGGMIPIIYLDAKNTGAYIAFEWTSSRIKAEKIDGGVAVSLDLREGFDTSIPAGGAFFVPPIYIGVYNGDIDDGSNLFKRWFFLEKTPKTVLNNPNEPFVQMDQQLDLNVEGLGIQSIKWDYGWWSDEKLETGNNDIWKYYEGSWKLRCADYQETLKHCGCSTMAEFGQKLQRMGLNWTVYVLLHDALKPLTPGDELTSVGATGHPEWFTGRLIGDKCPTADLGNQACIEYCKRKLLEFFTSNHIGTWRSDFEPIPRSSDKANRHDANGTDVQYWCSRGFYEIVDYLIEAIPGFRYESCSSGGSMKDYATMHRAAVFNNDDSSDYVSLRTTFYDSSYCFPPAQLQAPLNPDTFCPDCEKYYAGIGDKDFGFRAMIMGAVMLGSWSGSEDHFHLKYDLRNYYNKYVNLHNDKIKPIMRDGNLYHILPRPDNIHWDGMQYGCDFVPQNRVGGISFLFKPTSAEGSTKQIPVRGLNPDYTYRAQFYQRTEQSFSATGRELMEKGFRCTIDAECGSEMVFFMLEDQY